jgi:Uma2 family endonuclease
LKPLRRASPFLSSGRSRKIQDTNGDEKFAAYRTIPAFREYLLIEQSRVHVEHYVKQGVNQWLFTEYDGLVARLTLAAMTVEVGLADLYEAVEFGEVGANAS